MADLNSIQFKRIITTKVRPTAAQLLEGELAINLADGRIYTKDDSDIVKSLSDFTHGGVITNNFPYDNILSPGFYYDTNLALSVGKPSTEVTGTGYLLVFNTMDTSNESNVVVASPGSVTTQMFIGGLSGYVWTRTKPTLAGAWTTWSRPIYNGDPVNLKDTITLEATNAANGVSLIFKNASNTTIGYIKYVEATGLMFNAGVHTMTLNKTTGNLLVPGTIFEGANRVYSPNNIPTTDVIWAVAKLANVNADLVAPGQWKVPTGTLTNYPTLYTGNANRDGFIECIKTNTGLIQNYLSTVENVWYTRTSTNGTTWSVWTRLITIDTTELTKLTQISSSGLNVTGSVTTPTVNATVGVNTSRFNSATAFSFYTTSSSAQYIYTGGLLASDVYIDGSKVPTNGIYSKGNILTIGTVTAPTFIGALTGNADSATRLQTARNFQWTGDATGLLSFNGTANVSAALTLANTGVGAGTYQSVTVDTKGRVTAANTVITGLISSSSTANTASVATTNTNTYLNVVENTGGTLTSTGSSIQVTGAGTITVTSDVAGKLTITGSQTITGNAATATKLQTARTINGVSFDGTANINIQPVSILIPTNADLNNYTDEGFFYVPASATAATILNCPTAIAFSLQVVKNAGVTQTVIEYETNNWSVYQRNQYQTTWSAWRRIAFTDDNAASATKLETARTLSWTGDATGSLSFNGSANVSAALTLSNSGVAVGTYKSVTVDSKGRVTGGNEVVTGLITSTTATSTSNVATTNTNTYLNIIETVGSAVSTAGSSSQITGAGTVTVTSDATGKITITGSQNITGDAATAVKLATARTINGVAFDGTSNITIADSTKLPLAGGTMTGDLVAPTICMTRSSFVNSGISWHTSTYTAFNEYVANAASTGNGYTGTITAPTGVLVTSWAKRSTMQNTAGYGWTFESVSNTGTTPAIVAEINYLGASRWSGAMAIAPASGTASLTLGSTAGTNTTHIDFMPAANTYIDARIQASGGNAANFGGTLTFSAASSVFSGTVTTSGAVSVGSLSVTGNATVNGTLTNTRFSSASAYSFLNGSAAQSIMTGGVLASSNYADASKVPTNGIYSKGNILSDGTITTTSGFVGSLTGNAATATKLQTARTINGVSFDGTANITIAAETPYITAITSDATLASATTPGLYSVVEYTIAGLYNYGLLRVWSNGSVWNQMFISHNSSSNGSVAIRQSWNGANGYNAWRVIDSPNVTGNAATATVLQTARTLSWTGDAAGSLSFNGSANVSAALTLANSGVAAGTYKSVTVDAKGRVTAGTNVVTGLITSTDATGTTNVATANNNTFLNIIETIGASTTTTGPSSQITGAGTVTVTSDTAGKITITGSQTVTGNAGSATKLQTARTINGTAFNGTTDIILDTNMFMGQVQWFNGARANIPDGWIAADGQLVNRTDFPDLWRDVNAGVFTKVTDAVWLNANLANRAAYSLGNGSSTFRIPDLNGVYSTTPSGLFLRGDGGGTIAGVTVNPGMVQGDTIRNITGSAFYGYDGDVPTTAPSNYTSGTFRYGTTVANDTALYLSVLTSQVNKWYPLEFDASGSVPTSNENRPVSAVGVWMIRARGTTNPLAPISGSPATLLANTFNGSQKIVGNLEVTGNITVGGFITRTDSDIRTVENSNYTLVYDYSTRIVRIIMKAMVNLSIIEATSPFKVLDGAWVANFILPISIKTRLSAEMHFNNTGLTTTRWVDESSEWMVWCAPVGVRGSTENMVVVNARRWYGNQDEKVDGYLVVTGIF